MSKKAFVISDVHLKKIASPSGEAILRLIKKAQSEADLFIILGDLFDLWLGDGEYFQTEYWSLVKEIKKLKKSCRVIFFEGNHDLHLKKFWHDQLGVEVYTSPQLLEYGGLKIWAEHGDEINRKDRDYLFLRWLLRTKPLEYLIYHLPSNVSAFVGERASIASRAYTQKIENKSLGMIRSYAQKLRQSIEFDYFLVGHTHEPDDFKFPTGMPPKFTRLINLGSWVGSESGSPCYLEIDAETGAARIVKT